MFVWFSKGNLPTHTAHTASAASAIVSVVQTYCNNNDSGCHLMMCVDVTIMS